MKKFLLIATLLMFAPAALAVPATDIWLIDLAKLEQGIAVSGEPKQLTFGGGYDNQPMFVGEDKILFTSMDEAGQTDIWSLDIGANEAARLLETPESEYSPTPTLGGEIAVVRVDGEGVQQLWTLTPGAKEYELVFPQLTGIGYQAWLDAEHVALFMVTDPPELHIANRMTGEVVKLAKDIGRSLHAARDGSGDIFFSEPGVDGKRWIKRLSLEDRRITPIAPVLEGSEDFALLPSDRLVMASGKQLFVWREKNWQLISAFEKLPGDITRIAVSPSGGRLAFVANEKG